MNKCFNICQYNTILNDSVPEENLHFNLYLVNLLMYVIKVCNQTKNLNYLLNLLCKKKIYKMFKLCNTTYDDNNNINNNHNS